MVRRSHRGVLWGAAFDGVAGTLRAPISRALPLAYLCTEVALLGLATPALMMCLAGSLVSVLLCRRRMLSLMDWVYTVPPSRYKEETASPTKASRCAVGTRLMRLNRSIASVAQAVAGEHLRHHDFAW